MKSNTLFTKLVAMLLCLLMVVGCLPVAAFAANDWEGEIDVVEPAPEPGSSLELAIQLTALENVLEVAAGKTMYYFGYNLGGMEMSVSGPDFEVIVGEETYTPDENGLLQIAVSGSPRMPYYFAITNKSEENGEYYVNFNYPEGTQNNPKDLEEGENTVTLEAGNMGYFFDFVSYTFFCLFQLDSNVGAVLSKFPATQGRAKDTPAGGNATVPVGAGKSPVQG